jgi:antifreeze-like protein
VPPDEPDPEPDRPVRDPLGKRALFSTPPPVTGRDEAVTGADEAVTGRDEAVTGADEAVTGADEAVTGRDEAVTGDDPIVEHGPITVTCSTCGAVSRIGVLDFVIYQLPVGYWVPRGRFGHRMTCPSCRRRVWAGVTLR